MSKAGVDAVRFLMGSVELTVAEMERLAADLLIRAHGGDETGGLINRIAQVCTGREGFATDYISRASAVYVAETLTDAGRPMKYLSMLGKIRLAREAPIDLDAAVFMEAAVDEEMGKVLAERLTGGERAALAEEGKPAAG